MTFQEYIKNANKAERHLHGGLGCSLKTFEKICNTDIPSPPLMMNSLEEMNYYVSSNILPHFYKKGVFERVIQSSVYEAIADKVVILEMSIDSKIRHLYDNTISGPISMLNYLLEETNGKIDFRPELGIDRSGNPSETYRECMELIETGIFKSIDLYGIENAGDINGFKKLFKSARQKGLKLKVHSGEFLDANSVLKTIKILEPDELQHGISISSSKPVMKYVKDSGIRLNICPTSNLRLGRIKSMAEHPAKILFHEGINITINTDDIMIFGQSLSEEYLNLYNAGVFSENELKTINTKGLEE